MQPMTPCSAYTCGAIDRRPGPRYCVQPDWIGHRRLVSAGECAIADALELAIRPYVGPVGPVSFDVKERGSAWWLLCDMYIHNNPTANFRDRFLLPIRAAMMASREIMDVTVETLVLESTEDIERHKDEFCALGYDSIVLRHAGSQYCPGKTCASAIRMAAEKTAKAKIIGISTGASGMAIMKCAVGEAVFSCLAPGSIRYKRYIAESPADFIGRTVVVKYTKTGALGVPVHPIAMEVRHD